MANTTRAGEANTTRVCATKCLREREEFGGTQPSPRRVCLTKGRGNKGVRVVNVLYPEVFGSTFSIPYSIPCYWHLLHEVCIHHYIFKKVRYLVKPPTWYQPLAHARHPPMRCAHADAHTQIRTPKYAQA